jgi:hypothetical protein
MPFSAFPRFLTQGLAAMAASALLALLPMSSAHADACASGSSCSFHLTNSNVSGLALDLLVGINNTGPNTVLTISYVTSNLSNTPLGIDQFGYGSLVQPTVFQAGWSLSGCNPGCQMDGFGTFGTEVSNGGGTDLSASFTLASLVTSFDGFAAHIRFAGIPEGTSCSGFASDRTTQSSDPLGGCQPTDQRLPEPATLLLLALGLLAVAVLGRGAVRS